MLDPLEAPCEPSAYASIGDYVPAGSGVAAIGDAAAECETAEAGFEAEEDVAVAAVVVGSDQSQGCEGEQEHVL